jgi:hypothetical protein
MSDIQGKYFRYSVKKDTTVSELLSEKTSLFKNYQNKEQEFFDIKESNSDTRNIDRIWGYYTDIQRKEYNTDFNVNNTLSVINKGTILTLPNSEALIELSLINSRNLFLEQSDFQAFYADAYKTINNDLLNIPATKELDQSGNIIAQLKNYEISVWIYSKALDKILDVTQFVYSISTSSEIENGGSFNLGLSTFDDLDNIIIDGENLTVIHRIADQNTGEIPIPYFNKVFQHKDLLWIKFEKLALEKDRTGKVVDDLEVLKTNLDNQVYDMIGVIDQIVESSAAASTDKTLTITGQDLNQLLIDDANYFLPIKFIEGADTLMFNTQDESRLAKRNFLKGGIYENFFTFSLYKIKDAIGFIVNQLSNLGLVNNDLFSGYSENNDDNSRSLGERRTQAIRIQSDNELVGWAEVNGVWQIIDVLVDSVLEDRRQANSLLVKSEGTLMQQMKSICQEPFVEFMGDTYGDKFTFFARQKPFTKNAILDYLNSNQIVEIGLEDILSYNLNWETEFYSWYQIEPNSSFLGDEKWTSLAYIPIVFLETIAETFGNHRYVIADSYISERALSGDKQDPIANPFREAIINDLIYMIETTSYLPFTRKGSITINGDRRIKKGTWIRFKPTGEVFYVNGVNNSYSASRNVINRETSINVSRGMKEDYILGLPEEIDGRFPFISYFDIIDTTIIKKSLTKILTEQNPETGTEVSVKQSKNTTRANFDVDKDVFNFFLRRRQFDL